MPAKIFMKLNNGNYTQKQLATFQANMAPTSENQSSAISQDQGFGEKPRTPAVVTPLKNQSSSKKKQENNTRKK